MYIPGSDVQIFINGNDIEVKNAGKLKKFNYLGLDENEMTTEIINITYSWGLRVIRNNISIAVRHLGIKFTDDAQDLSDALDILDGLE